MTSVDLPEPETPVTQQKTPSGISTSMPFRLCWRAPRTISSPRGSRRFSGTGSPALPARYWPVRDAGSASTAFGVALGDHVAAVLAGPGAEIHDVVGRAHRPLVVLDHDHGVAEVAQPGEGVEQLGVVPLVQADRGLVEDVEDPDQAGADLRREPDPLGLAAREGSRRARQVEVADPDVFEEGEPLGDLPDQQPRDRLLGLGQLQLLDPLQRRPGRQLACTR